ncbi:helix-turn-helix domain-containing protein [Roseomonas sp. PWR1]|uniref:Helix-turn-helix domain-containing protein n=1 Tax=Roseomonas nitratireducens TaxID=2820810 RepID=A0ABS4AYJ4_9PROT|nr:helix-turn-helix domain-containing protein [Neoroseomonas nitratireducens]MBP0465883.1 helix-turn-helix domain-containing protein [Neoroseomonas nitratireducens]
MPRQRLRDLSTIGGKIAQAREDSGLSQDKLARHLGLSRSAIAQWENNLCAPSFENAKSLSRLLDIDIKDILDFADFAADEKEKTILHLFRSMHPNDQKFLLIITSHLCSDKTKRALQKRQRLIIPSISWPTET